MRDSKRCVTAYWLSDTMTKRQVAPPWQALHLPLMYAAHDRPAQRHRASITGFVGEERDRVRFMLEHTGAKVLIFFTITFVYLYFVIDSTRIANRSLHTCLEIIPF